MRKLINNPAKIPHMADGETSDDDEEKESVEWLPKKWYATTLGRGIFAVDVILTVLLVVSTTLFFAEVLEEPVPSVDGGVPAYVYVFALLGALGYVFTTLAEDFHRSTGKLIQYNIRLPAALPLGVGIFLFAEMILADAAESQALVAGLAFLTGLYVNLAYQQLGALAERLLPGGSEEDEGESSEREDSEDIRDEE